MMKLRDAHRRPVVVLWAILACMAVFPSAAPAGTCQNPAAEVVSLQGNADLLPSGRPDEPGQWRQASLGEKICAGDTLKVRKGGRADLALADETLVRVEQGTTVRIAAPERDRTSLLDLLIGALYFITRTPKSFEVRTPYMNAGAEGTEFLVRCDGEQAVVTVFEGKVQASNAAGRIVVASGQSAGAAAGRPPEVRVVARPRDAVRWTLYYPPLYSEVPGSPAGGGAPPGWEARAASLLAAGQADEAGAVIDETLAGDPKNGAALAFKSVIAVARNDKEAALSLGRKAVEAAPETAPPRIALAYALQASFDLPGATLSLEEAVKREPGNALAWARLAELRLSSGDLDGALEAARRASSLAEGVSRTQTVLGYSFLSRQDAAAARDSFRKGVALDSADPLPRLGLGLSMIREGDLAGGRREIEIAASLDTTGSLIRSYLGKAYFEENRDRQAAGQFAMAKEFDPADPTPWFYDAVRAHSVNRPVEALKGLQESIRLNDNRAVYRSRLLLDEDLAARGASLGRIYDDLGFRQLALAEGWKSVAADPANPSAHRFLADSYAVLPRHQIARVSELLASQLLQPLSIAPVQPQTGESRQLLLSGSGPSSPSFNEFNSLFERDRYLLQMSAVGGRNATWGDELVHSGVQGRYSYSLGQFHYETDGFRKNGDLSRDIYNAFFQVVVTPKTSIQFELRRAEADKGDLTLRFDPENYSPFLRQEEKSLSGRLGIHHRFSPGSDLLGSLIYQHKTSLAAESLPGSLTVDIRDDIHSYTAELQHLYRAGKASLVLGAGRSETGTDEVIDLVFFVPFPPFSISSSSRERSDNRQTNVYAYSRFRPIETVSVTAGASVDIFTSNAGDRDQFNPKLGLTWTPLPGTTLRAAVFKALKKELVTDQTVEPTEVAGFNQFFDDPRGTRSWRYGVAVDRVFSKTLFGGAEYSRRDLKVPHIVVAMDGTKTVSVGDAEERTARAYCYWTPNDRAALSAEYHYERIANPPDSPFDYIARVSTHKVPLGAAYFHPFGATARIRATFYDQDGVFLPRNVVSPTETVPGSDRFWLFDASLSCRLPQRLGIVSLEGKNLFDKTFRFQDTDHDNPAIQPGRMVLFKVLLAI
jgi:ferric-dicitrate binding protein FerR (iron transport regulator)